ncbi:dihydroorotate dehydrogenase electron transfer subunit [Sporomusa aerivorans]|uniref:dihydroorotate dehydrogenase electron transfer subunit n=1 Tax=Sporomusa aerivorans TaxID=204936 RepID=UPI00352A918A
MGKKFWQETQIVENIPVNTDTYYMKIYAPDIAANANPGQFVMAEVNMLQAPLLNRPLGIAGVDKRQKSITIFYRVVGKGTYLLSQKRKAECIRVLGPLGNGFELKAQRPLLIGGGMGLAPLLFAAQATCPVPVEVIAGGRTENELFWKSLFEEVCQQVHITTDDGSLGTKGTCVSPLASLLSKNKFDAMLACGPIPMLRAVVEYAQSYRIPCQVSLEEHMACGFGACLTCTCEKQDGGYFQVCKQGPVFRAGEVKL